MAASDSGVNDEIRGDTERDESNQHGMLSHGMG